MNFFDAHTHLNHADLYKDRQSHIQEFKSQGGLGLVNIGVDHTYNTRGIEIAQKSVTLFPDTIIKASIWLHPYEIATGNITTDNSDQKLQEMKDLYTQDNQQYIVAIGEIGIDTYWPDTEQTIEFQKEIFRHQCKFARQIELPIVIHSRSNRPATHEVLQDFTDLTIYFHCRPYGPEEIKTIKDTYPDFYIWFCGNISYPKADNIRKSLRYLVYENEDYPEHIISGKIKNITPVSYSLYDIKNISNLLIETDAPYLTPQIHRGKQNTPVLVEENYTYISSLLSTDISLQVIDNTKRCYRLDK